MVVPVPRVAYIVEEMEDDEVIELFVARTGIELFAARLAASSITDAEIAYLEENLRGMEDALKGGEVDKLAGLDTLFHQTVAEAGRNRYLVQATQLLVQKTLGLVQHVFISRKLPGRPWRGTPGLLRRSRGGTRNRSRRPCCHISRM